MFFLRPTHRLVFCLCASCVFICVIALLLTHAANAGREVVSDIDCVVEPSVVAQIGSSVPGLLEDVHFDRSDYVQTGSVLASLESGVEKAALNLAERVASHSTAITLRKLNAAFGERTENRNQALFQKSSISSQNMDQVSTEAEIGTISKRFKSVGEYVEGEPVYELLRLDPLHVEVILPLEHLGTVTAGMSGEISLNVPGLLDEHFEATVRRIDPLADPASATYGVQLELPNPDLKIPAGEVK